MNQDYNIYYYFENNTNEYVTVISVDFVQKIVFKTVYVKLSDVKNIPFAVKIDEEFASVLLFGFVHKYYMIQEAVANKPNKESLEKIKSKYRFSELYNSNVLKNSAIIDEEHKLFSEFWINCNKYYDIKYERDENIIKAVNSLPDDERRKLTIHSDDYPEKLRLDELNEKYRNDIEYRNDVHNLNIKWLQENEYYKKSVELLDSLNYAFLDYLKSFEKLDKHFEKERELFTQKYNERLEEYYSRGIILYWQNTPDLPIEYDDISEKDIFNHFLMDNCLYIQTLTQQYTDNDNMSESMVRKADDIIACIEDLQRRRYRSALRNLFSLIDGEHKKCSKAFNGYFEFKEKYKNGLERSNHISQIVDFFQEKYFIELWNKIDKLCKDLQSKDGIPCFPKRSSIIHGDYKDDSMDVNEYDVLKVLFLYLCLRMLADRLLNLEELNKGLYEALQIGLTQMVVKNKKI